VFAEYTGRGPTRARTTIRDNVIVCITEDNMTKAERRLTQEGEAALVVTVRRRFQSTMRDDLVDAGADVAAEVFVLDGSPRLPAAPMDVGGAH
jgi:uncharacterized protein YbcI